MNQAQVNLKKVPELFSVENFQDEHGSQNQKKYATTCAVPCLHPSIPAFKCDFQHLNILLFFFFPLVWFCCLLLLLLLQVVSDHLCTIG